MDELGPDNDSHGTSHHQESGEGGGDDAVIDA